MHFDAPSPARSLRRGLPAILILISDGARSLSPLLSSCVSADGQAYFKGIGEILRARIREPGSLARIILPDLRRFMYCSLFVFAIRDDLCAATITTRVV